MSGFQLDTSGFVQCPAPNQKPNESTGCWFWPDLSPFAQGYVEALFASDEMLELWRSAKATMEAEKYGSHMMWVPGFSDLSPEALAMILRDCAQAVRTHYRNTYDSGERFFAARQRPSPLHLFPPLTPILSEDGKVNLVVQAQVGGGE